MNKTYFPVHVHSHYSLLDGLSKPEDIAKRCNEIGVEGSALTDHGSISGHIDFMQTMQKKGKKPLLGCEFYVSSKDATIKDETNRKLTHLCIIAKNDDGWNDMVQMVSKANEPELFYHKPRLDLNRIAEFAQKGNLLAFSGHIGSHMSNILFDSDNNLQGNWKLEGTRLANWFKDAFGPNNFWLEVQLMDMYELTIQKQIGDCIREISKETRIPCIATQDAHYAGQEQAIDQRVLLCSNLRTTMEQARLPQSGMSGFFRSNQYHIPSYDEMREWNTEEELEQTLVLASQVEEYKNILKSPVLPEFQCPGGMKPDEYFRELCKQGWKEKVEGKIPKEKHQEYADRVKSELEVLQGAELSSYFLIVADILDFVKKNGWLPGPGRGSAAGCLVSYLVGITSIDPIPYDLIFERFYNAGRNTADHISMPDIDIDIPKHSREFVIEYIRQKYGEDHVGQMITFSTMKGRGALKDVMRAWGGVSNDEMNEITKNIIEEHKISDELQKMKEERGDSSIILWCLENLSNKLDKWCYLDDDNKLQGPLAFQFEQAMRLEGVKTNTSKHAAGVVIAPQPLSEMCPMVFDKESGRMIAGFEMNHLESAGGIKFDVLGIAALDKAMGIKQDLATGEIHEISRIEYKPDFYE